MILLFLLIITSCPTEGQKMCSETICLHQDYNKLDLPAAINSSKNSPHVVEVSFSILEIYEINYKEFTMSFGMDFRTTWRDDMIMTNITDKDIDVNLKYKNEIWMPDLYIYKLKSVKDIKTATGDLCAGLSIRKNKDGVVNVTYSVLLEVVITCYMDFDNFPFDKQMCDFKVSSFSHRQNELIFSKEPGNDVIKNLNIHTVRDYVPSTIELGEDERSVEATWGTRNVNYSLCGFKIRLVQRYRKYLYVYYLPTTLFVVASWVSFLLPPTAYPARLAKMFHIIMVFPIKLARSWSQGTFTLPKFDLNLLVGF